MVISAREASATAIANRAKHIATAKRNKKAAGRDKAARDAKWDKEWAESNNAEFDKAIAQAVARGHHTIRKHVATMNESMSVTKMLQTNQDGPMYRKIFARLRRAGYQIVVKMKSEYHDGISYYEGVSDSDPWTGYEYTAVVKW